MSCWEPAIELSKKEPIHHQTAEADAEAVRVSSAPRHELFDDKFSQSWRACTKTRGAGDEPVPPRAVVHGAAAPRLHRISDAEGWS